MAGMTMSNATNLRGPDGEELVKRFAGRQPTAWTADALRGKSMVPPASPMQNMVDNLRAPVAPAPVAPPITTKYTPPPVNPATGGYTANERIIQSGAGAGQANPRTAPVDLGAPAPGVQAAGAGPGSGGRTGVPSSVRERVSNLRTGLGAQPGPISKSAFLAGKVLSSPLVAGAGRLAGAAAVAQNLNDYKINDPDVDSSASGTWNALRSGDFSGAGQSLKKGLVETGMDLGSFAANTADLVVPGNAPVSTAYNKMLRDNLGNMLVDNSGASTAANVPGSPGTQPGANAPAPQTYPNVNATANARMLRLGDPSSPDLKDEFSNAMIENRNPGGKVTKVGNSYSGGNVSGEVSFQGAKGNALRGRPGGGYMSTDTSAGFAMDKQLGDQMQADRLRLESEGYARQDKESLANTERAKSYEEDLARRNTEAAATSIDRGTRANALRSLNAMDKKAVQDAVNKTTLRTADMNNATSRANNANTNKTALRGQDLEFEGKRLSSAATRAQLRYTMGKDQRDYDTQRYDKGLEQDRAAASDAASAFKGLFDTTDKDGKPIARPDLEAQANLVAKRASGGKWATLSPDERAKNIGNAHSYVTLLDSARQHQNNGWLQAAGVDSPDAPWGGLPSPDELSKGTLERVGLREGMMTPGTSKGDYALRLPDGRVMYLGSNVSGEHLKYLRNQGVK